MFKFRSVHELETIFIEKLSEKYKLNERDLRRAFARFDTDKNGFIDLNELSKMVGVFLSGVDETQIAELMSLYDKNNDGNLSYEELLEYLTTRSATKSFKPQNVSEKVQKNRDAVALRKMAESKLEKTDKNLKSNMENQSFTEDDESEDVFTEPDNVSIMSHGSSYISEASSSSNIADIYRRPSTTSSNTSYLSEVLDTGSLQAKTKILFECLRNQLTEKALLIRKSNPLKDKIQLPLNEYLQKEGRNILIKAFQQYSGNNHGRATDRTSGIDFNDFARVLRSFKIPGIPSIRQEIIEYIFGLCIPPGSNDVPTYPTTMSRLMNKPNIENNLNQLADSNIFVDLVFGLIHKSNSYINQLNKGREIVSTGPFHQPDPVDNNKSSNVADTTTNAIALRFVNHKTRSALRPPSNFRNEWVAKSSKLPDYDCVRSHVYGMSSALQSGQSFHILPSNSSSKTNVNDITILYSSASIGVIHNLQSNQQSYFDHHDDDITAVAVSLDGTIAATGCCGKYPSIYIWSTNEQSSIPNKVLSTKVPSNSNSGASEKSGGRLTCSIVNDGISLAKSHSFIKEIGKDFFERSINAICFSFDHKYIIGIGCDDHHTMGIFDLASGDLILNTGTQNGIPPQIKDLVCCPTPQYTEYITRNHKGLCDVFCTVGERHIRLWSFLRPGNNEKSSIEYKAPTTTKIKVSAPKIYNCALFIPCDDNTYDLVSGGSNGLVYLYRKGEAITSSKAIFGGITCLEYQLDKLFVGGSNGIVKILDNRTLSILQSFNIPDIYSNQSSSPMKPSSRSSNRSMSRPSSSRQMDRDDRSVSSRSASSRRSSITSVSSTKSIKPVDISNRPTINQIKKTKVSESPGVSNSPVANVTGLAVIPLPSNRSNSQIPGHLYCSISSGITVRINLSTYDSTDKSSLPIVTTLFHFHVGCIYAVAVANEMDKINFKQRVIATSGDDKWLCIWDAKHKTLLSKCLLDSCCRSLAFDQTNTYIAVGATNGLYIYSINDTQTLLYPLTLSLSTYRKDSPDQGNDVKFSPNNALLALASNDNYIYVYQFIKSTEKTMDNSTCQLKLIFKLKGHSSYLTHIDWSLDSTLLRSTCGAYELLLWDIATGKLNGITNISDIKWKSNHCIFDFSLMGIWPPFADGTDINAIDVCSDKLIGRELVITADDSGYINLLNYPCLIQYAPRKIYSGHSSHVLNIRMFHPSAEDLNIVSVGGNDCSVMIWDVISTTNSNNNKTSQNNRIPIVKTKVKSLPSSHYENTLN